MGSRVATVLVVLAGLAVLAGATDGFRAITSEGARRLDVRRNPRQLPATALVDHRGMPFSWKDLEGDRLLVEFIYTTCPDMCQRMSTDFRTLVQHYEATDADVQVRFLSVSFDRANDTLERLSAVAAGYGADGDTWRFARVEREQDLDRLLEVFGVVALPVSGRGFEHNAAIHGVDERGRLVRIADIDSAEAMLEWAVSWPRE